MFLRIYYYHRIVIDMFLEFIVLIFFVVILFLWYDNRQWKKKFDEKVRRSSLVLSGKTMEKLVPFLEKFSHDAHDIRWLGDPVDFIIFDGLSEGNSNQITFCEVKSGNSQLSNRQRKIKKLIEKKKVKWEEFRIK